MAQETETYNYRDIDRLIAKMKTMMVKQLMKDYGTEAKALAALKAGEYKISVALFDEARHSCLPTPKDGILREIDQWEEQIKRGQDGMD